MIALAPSEHAAAFISAAGPGIAGLAIRSIIDMSESLTGITDPIASR